MPQRARRGVSLFEAVKEPVDPHGYSNSFCNFADDINRDAELTALDIDSLDLAELSQIIEEQFGVELTSADVAEIHTVGDAIDLVVERA